MGAEQSVVAVGSGQADIDVTAMHWPPLGSPAQDTPNRPAVGPTASSTAAESTPAGDRPDLQWPVPPTPPRRASAPPPPPPRLSKPPAPPPRGNGPSRAPAPQPRASVQQQAPSTPQRATSTSQRPEQDVAIYLEEVDRLRTEVERLTPPFMSQSAEVERLTSSENSLRAEVEQLTSSAISLREEVERLASSEFSLRAELERLTKLRDELVFLGNQTAVQLTHLHDRIAELERLGTASADELNLAVAQRARLEADMAARTIALEHEHAEREKETAVQVAELVQKNAQLRVDVKTAAKRASTSEVSLVEAQARIEELEKELEAGSARAEVDSSRAVTTEAIAETGAQARIEALEKELEAARAESDSARAATVSAQAAARSARAESMQVARAAASMRAETESVRAESARLSKAAATQLAAAQLAAAQIAVSSPRPTGSSMTEEEAEALFPNLGSLPMRLELALEDGDADDDPEDDDLQDELEDPLDGHLTRSTSTTAGATKDPARKRRLTKMGSFLTASRNALLGKRDGPRAAAPASPRLDV